MSIRTSFNPLGTLGEHGRIPRGYVRRGLVFMLDALSEPHGTVDGMTDLVSGRRVRLNGTGENSASGLSTSAELLRPTWFPGQPVGNTAEIRGMLKSSGEFFWRESTEFSVRFGAESLAILYLALGNTGYLNVESVHNFSFSSAVSEELVLDGDVWTQQTYATNREIDTDVLFNKNAAPILLNSLRLYNRPLTLEEIRQNMAADEQRYSS